MVVETSLPTIGTVLITAAIDSINPCAIGVLILLISVMIALRSKVEMLKYGLIYIAAVYVTYLSAGLAGVELPCTGGPYLAILVFLSQNFNLTAFFLLLFYNVIFVMPLVVILLMVHFGYAKVQTLKRWKQANRTYMRLATGVILILLGWLLILIANGTITFN